MNIAVFSLSAPAVKTVSMHSIDEFDSPWISLLFFEALGARKQLKITTVF